MCRICNVFVCTYFCLWDGWMDDTHFTFFTRKKVQILQKWGSQRRQQQRSPTLAIARPVRRRQFSKASILQVDRRSAYFGTSNERSYSQCSKEALTQRKSRRHLLPQQQCQRSLRALQPIVMLPRIHCVLCACESELE